VNGRTLPTESFCHFAVCTNKGHLHRRRRYPFVFMACRRKASKRCYVIMVSATFAVFAFDMAALITLMTSIGRSDGFACCTTDACSQFAFAGGPIGGAKTLPDDVSRDLDFGVCRPPSYETCGIDTPDGPQFAACAASVPAAVVLDFQGDDGTLRVSAVTRFLADLGYVDAGGNATFSANVTLGPVYHAFCGVDTFEDSTGVEIGLNRVFDVSIKAARSLAVFKLVILIFFALAFTVEVFGNSKSPRRCKYLFRLVSLGLVVASLVLSVLLTVIKRGFSETTCDDIYGDDPVALAMCSTVEAACGLEFLSVYTGEETFGFAGKISLAFAITGVVIKVAKFCFVLDHKRSGKVGAYTAGDA